MISFIFPAFQEAENLKRFPTEVIPVFDRLNEPYEIVIVDDGSRDETAAVSHDLERLPLRHGAIRLVQHDRNCGLGAAIRTGMAAAKGELVITMDTDLTFAPTLVPALLTRYRRGDCDVVSGSPKLAGFGRDIPSYRIFISRAATLVYRLVMGAHVTTVSPIFRLYKRDDLMRLPLQSTGFDINAEILFHLIRAGCRVVEIPAPLTQRIKGESKLNYRKEMIRHFKLLTRMIALRWKGQGTGDKGQGVLVFTQAMDEKDSNLNFFVEWVRRLADEMKRPIHVLCWKRGTLTDLPPSVIVTEVPRGKLKRTLFLWRWSWTHRKKIQSVFVHMVPSVVVAAGPLWKALGWKVVLWYTHGTVSSSLTLASWFADAVLTASPESCRLSSSKVKAIGHGIDLDQFHGGDGLRQPILLTVGRISRRKDLVSAIELVKNLRSTVFPLRFLIVGAPLTDDDRAYERELREEVKRLGLEGIVTFTGPKFGEELARAYREAALFVSTSRTGSLDKAVLEALASETPALVVGASYIGFPAAHMAAQTWDEASRAFARGCLERPVAHPEAREGVRARADLSVLIKKIAQELV